MAEGKTSRSRASLIYVMGLPYSGSTLFSLALGNSPGVVNLGEAIFIANDWQDERRCSCGKTLQDCEFWTRVRHAQTGGGPDTPPPLQLRDEARLEPMVGRRSPFLKRLMVFLGVPLRAVFGWDEVLDYAQTHGGFVDTVAKEFEAEFVVDASKSVKRLNVLSEFTDLEIRIVFLRREMREVMASRLKRARRRNARYTQAVAPVYFFWSMYHASLLKRMQRKFTPSEFITIRYEDFCDDPKSVERTLQDWLGVPIDFGIGTDNGIDASDCHVYTGNIWLTKREDINEPIFLKSGSSYDTMGRFERATIDASMKLLSILRL